MRLILPLLILILLITACKSNVNKGSENTTIYYLIRHAEKDRSDSAAKDPVLTPIGHERAKLWSHYFDSIPLDYIYSTDYERTQQTVMYLSRKTQLPIQSYSPGSLIDSNFLQKTKGRHVVICGHSNTTPETVNKLIQSDTYPQMDDADNSSLYVVSIKADGSTEVHIRKVNLPKE